MCLVFYGSLLRSPVCKLVGVDLTMDDALDTLNAHLALNRTDSSPYALTTVGDPLRIVRPIAPMFISAGKSGFPR